MRVLASRVMPASAAAIGSPVSSRGPGRSPATGRVRRRARPRRTPGGTATTRRPRDVVQHDGSGCSAARRKNAAVESKSRKRAPSVSRAGASECRCRAPALREEVCDVRAAAPAAAAAPVPAVANVGPQGLHPGPVRGCASRLPAAAPQNAVPHLSRAASSSASRLLPIPASPGESTSRPRPARASASASSSSDSSRSACPTKMPAASRPAARRVRRSARRPRRAGHPD